LKFNECDNKLTQKDEYNYSISNTIEKENEFKQDKIQHNHEAKPSRVKRRSSLGI